MIIAGPHAKRCAKHYTRRIMSAALMEVYRRCRGRKLRRKYAAYMLLGSKDEGRGIHTRRIMPNAASSTLTGW